MFKKVIYLGLMAGAIHFADAQKINLGNTDISFSPDWVVGNTISFTPIDNFQISLISKYIGER